MSRLPDIRRTCTLLLAGLVVSAALATGAGAGWITNSIALDPGTCGQILQVGTDPTAVATSKPSFLLQGDGGGSSYAVTIDKRRIGTFRSTGGGIVCIRTRKPLSQGPHLLVATELAPNAGRLVRLRFTVDTVAPRPPSQPSLAGTLGDDTEKTLTFSGIAAPNQAIQLIANGRAGVAGAISDAAGRWTATTVRLPAGTYAVTALTLDGAGNRSTPSAATQVTIGPAAYPS